MNAARLCGIALALVATGPAPLWAQPEPADEPLAGGFRFGLSVDAVHIGVTVVDKKGRLVTDLEREDFRVLEDGVPQEITFFSRGTDAPVDVMVLVDASGSMDVVSKVVNARNAALQLVESLGPEDRVAVFAFAGQLVRLSPLVADKAPAARALRLLEPFGATALYDAVARTSALVAHEGFGRRAIVLFTDGVDTASETSVDEALEIAKRVELPVYAVRVVSPLDDPGSETYVELHGASARGADALRRFAHETGGRLYEGSDLGELRLAARRIHEELKTQYRLGYSPQNTVRNGRFRRIEVRVARRGVHVRARKGYYAVAPRPAGRDVRTNPDP